MGIFDNTPASPNVNNVFLPSSKPPTTDPDLPYVFKQQNGCGVKLYPNTNDTRPVRHLFWEVQSCICDRSTVDLAGSFTIILNGTEPWDEYIQADDWVRIFMGDRISQQNAPGGLYNFASGVLDQNQSIQTKQKGVVFVPIPGTGPIVSGGKTTFTKQPAMNFLTMYERFVGKVDRIEKSVSTPTKDQAAVTTYSITGRGIGAVIEDLSVYYNQWLPGLNAINVFTNSNQTVIGSPDELVNNIIALFLSSVPMPQWNLPPTLVSDLNFSGIASANTQEVLAKLATFQQSLTNAAATQQNIAGSQDAIMQLQKAIQQIQSNPSTSPINVISTKGIQPCLGTGYNLTQLNSVTTGLVDMIRSISNPVFNEFFIDMCPAGNPYGGAASSQVVVPTIVMRQRPYDISSEMLNFVAYNMQTPAKNITNFPQIIETGISQTMYDLVSQAITVFGPMANANIKDLTSALSKSSSGSVPPAIFSVGNNVAYTPHLIKYDMGFSSHERFNGYLCRGSFGRGSSNQTDDPPLAAAGGFKFDPQSIFSYGFRMMEVSTQYAQPDLTKNQPDDIYKLLSDYSGILANWYFLNPQFLNGRIVSRFLADARLGIPCKYFETRITPNNPYPKMELSYIQGVTDTYQYGQELMTTLTLIRGIRYNLNTNSAGAVKSPISQLGPAVPKIAGNFGGIIGGGG